jgi:hypothetical protein
LGIFEIILFLVIALIVIPPDDLPQVMRAVGKVLRELRLASNTVMREISGAIGEDSPYNLLPPRFDDPLPPAPSTSTSPPPPAFLAPESQSQPPAENEPPVEAVPAPQASSADHTTEPAAAVKHQVAPPEPPSQPEAPPHSERPVPPADKP